MRYILGSLFVLAAAGHFDMALAAPGGEVEIRVVDGEGGELITVRMHLKDKNGKPVKIPKTIAWHDHFILPGKMTLALKPGEYTFELERGPEY
jgi:hypothetical protein